MAYGDCKIPESKKVTCKICHLGDNTGFQYDENLVLPHDLDERYHKGFTIGKGWQMYWMMIWHGKSGHVTVFSSGGEGQPKRRWIPGDTEITIHFK